MTRYAIDADTAIRIIREGLDVSPQHQLVGPAILRSHALSILYADVRQGRLEAASGRDQLEKLAALKVRLLNDRVSRAVAWKLAAQLDWDDTGPAEYLAVASLQADALVTENGLLVAAADGIIPVADFGDLGR